MTVELIDHLGSDLSIVNAARVSYHKRSEIMAEADAGLIGFLIRNRHGTPTEMVSFTFRVRCCIGVAREWFRHRIGSFNEESTRYVTMRKEFYLPSGDAIRRQDGKPGHYAFEPIGEPVAAFVRMAMHDAYEAAYQAYESLLLNGVARELARNVLPLGLLTEFVWTVNLRSLFNFLSLRTAPTALLEIRQEADEVERLIRPIVPIAMAAWDAGGRQAI